MAGKARRTTHRSVSGTKLYAVRDSKGRFKDIQTYEDAHISQVSKRKSKKGTQTFPTVISFETRP